MIIIEGPDLVGKTTLVKRLSEYYQLPNTIDLFRFKDRKEYENNIDIAEKIDYQWFKCFKNVNFIADRGLISPIIYSKLWNRPNYMTINDILDEFPKVFFIILCGDLDYVLTNHKKGDILYNKEQLKNIYKLYDSLMYRIYENEYNNPEYNNRIFFMNINNKSESLIFEKAKRLIDNFIVINRK